MTTANYRKLCSLLEARTGELYVALSGGIDSLTLMTIAAQVRQQPTIAMHAVSAAVPANATERCRALATKFQWQLQEIDAQEFSNPEYLSNPYNRCYFCKSSLFNAIQACARAAGNITVATGTNTDDLSDFRPGLAAAAEHSVWQPFVEAAISKDNIRAMARTHGLGTLAELPAAPCLASRVETGIAITAPDLDLIYQVEQLVARSCGAGDIRCRVLKRGVVVQVPAGSELLEQNAVHQPVYQSINSLCASAGKRFVGIEQYTRGSAFVKPVEINYAGS
ncbi:MAG: adenine nucleotide alpha hydrolase [Pseudomonadota bacterium]